MPKIMGTEERSSGDRARARADTRDAAPPLVLLFVSLGSLLVLDPQVTSPATIAWSVAPVLPAVWLVRTEIRSLGRADELQRMVRLEALAVGFGVLLLLQFVGGLLGGADVGEFRMWHQVSTVGGIVTWILAQAALRRRL